MKLKINKTLKKIKIKKIITKLKKKKQIRIKGFNWNFFDWRMKLKTNKTLTKKSRKKIKIKKIIIKLKKIKNNKLKLKNLIENWTYTNKKNKN